MTAAPSPAQMNDAMVETVLVHVEPAAIVEMIVWLCLAVAAPVELLLRGSKSILIRSLFYAFIFNRS